MTSRRPARVTPSSRLAHADTAAVPAPARSQARGHDLLDDGEVVILAIRPSPAFIVLASLPHLFAIGLGAFALIWLTSLGWLPLQTAVLTVGAIALGLARLGWQMLDWICRAYILTDRRLIRSLGVLRRNTVEIPLRSLQHIILSRSILERLLGLGTLGFATPGTDIIEAWWLTLSRPDEVRRTVRETVEKYGRPR